MSLLRNRKANFEYIILDKYDAGIVLTGNEVKSIRNSDATISDSFVFIKDNEVWIRNFKISRYKQAHHTYPHEENRDKKLLLTKRQINKISKSLKEKGITCIPLNVFIKSNRIKVKIGLAKGKKLYDKRNSIKDRDLNRDSKRQLSYKN